MIVTSDKTVTKRVRVLGRRERLGTELGKGRKNKNGVTLDDFSAKLRLSL